MYVSLKWLQDIIGIQKVSLKHLIHRLTLNGFEVEEIVYKKIGNNTDLILDISLTANRFDASNIKGLMWELSSIFSLDFLIKPPPHLNPLIILSPEKYQVKKIKQFVLDKTTKTKDLKFYINYKLVYLKHSIWENYLQTKNSLIVNKIIVDNQQLNKKNIILFSQKSQLIEVKESPEWVRKRLLAMDYNPMNNIVDIITLSLIESGQGIFGYDLDNIKVSKENLHSNLALIYNKDEINFSPIDLKDLTLPNKILTINLNYKAIGVVGLVQSKQTAITRNTKQILIQAGLYNTKQIKEFSKTLGLRTECSVKLEKPISLNLLEQAYLRLIHLFWTFGIKFEDQITMNNILLSKDKVSFFLPYLKNLKNIIKISYKNINTLIGNYKQISQLSNVQVQKSLKLLNFKIYLKTQQNCYLLIPSSRQLDIEQETDLIEEIVRINGFDKFSSRIPIKNQIGKITKLEKCKRRIRINFLDLGFNESLHSSLSYKSNICQLGLKNPLFNETSYLRSSLLPILLEKVKFNQKKTGRSFDTFEFGRIYRFTPNNRKKRELEVCSGIFGGNLFRSDWKVNTISPLNWFEAKGLIEKTFYKLNLHITWIPITSTIKIKTNFHPNRTAYISIGKQIVGIFGQVHPSISLSNNISKKTYLYEFNVEFINKFWQSKTMTHYLPFSSYPISYVDLSCTMKKNLLFDTIKQYIFSLGQPLLKSITLFDYYSKFPIKEGYYNLNFKLQFQSETKTLLNSEIDELTKFITTTLEKNFDIIFQ